jgi:hypothetical protein
MPIPWSIECSQQQKQRRFKIKRVSKTSRPVAAVCPPVTGAVDVRMALRQAGSQSVSHSAKHKSSSELVQLRATRPARPLVRSGSTNPNKCLAEYVLFSWPCANCCSHASSWLISNHNRPFSFTARTEWTQTWTEHVTIRHSRTTHRNPGKIPDVQFTYVVRNSTKWYSSRVLLSLGM